LLEEGAHLSIGAHHHLEGGTLERRELLQRQSKGKARLKAQAKARSKQRQREEDQMLAKEEGCIKEKDAWLQKASREIFKGLQGFREGVAIVTGSLVNVFHVVLFSLRPSIYIYSKLVFPMGGFSQGHVDQKQTCQFHACLEL
jgi:hypothetical protein